MASRHAREFNINKQQIAAFCRRHRIRKLWLFGSMLRDAPGPASEVDLLVEFQPGARALDNQ